MSILDRYPNATCIAHDGSAPMLEQARRLMANYGARFKTHLSDLTRLATVLRAIGIALDGQAAGPLAARLGLPTSATMLLRLVRGAAVPQAPALQVVGIDEWAWARCLLPLW